MPERVIPYTPKGTPKVETVVYNKANFKTVTWKVPEGVTYKGKIIYVHGFSEESGLYTEFFDKLSQQGYEIFFFDQRGAGETGKGGDVGVTDEFHTFDDLDFFIEREAGKRTDPEEKFTLMGHSMGGGIILNYPMKGKHKQLIKSVVASGPLVKLHPDTEPNIIIMKLQSVINALVPRLKIDSKLNYDHITSNEGWKEYVRNLGKLIGTIRQFHNMFARGARLLEPSYVATWDPLISLLVLHGDDDHINWDRSSQEFFKLLPKTVDAKYESIPGAKHAIFIELEEIFNSVFSKVVTFLDSH
ncbi:uncharacterized protein KQ657_000080 [Scheffersomyces spartinae]|uniref:Serine aminopeptidase S33 domain-containing protein n=1 Tax=Scheffersomyces spartinae TaxID=45513 RepID=A0A9P8ALG8_9ASCO|nr:uncharacterized protein KQ657_000080 [Scheffersomyces spartinae]KAG7196069.1 hypothetical protein KQ657_000080 [Scheffersomyces spartinae]